MRPRKPIAPESSLLLKQRADVNAAQADGMTALHWAVYHDDGELAKQLIARRRQRAERRRVMA